MVAKFETSTPSRSRDIASNPKVTVACPQSSREFARVQTSSKRDKFCYACCGAKLDMLGSEKTRVDSKLSVHVGSVPT